MEFKVGDIVDFQKDGSVFRGTIIKINNEIHTYPIEVDFGLCTKTFTLDGREYRDCDVCLKLHNRPVEYMDFCQAIKEAINGKTITCDDCDDLKNKALSRENLSPSVKSKKWRVL